MTDPMDKERDARIHAHWDGWLDHRCRCGFPHPKPGHYGPPPTEVEIAGVAHRFPPYHGVMGGYEPIPVSHNDLPPQTPEDQ